MSLPTTSPTFPSLSSPFSSSPAATVTGASASDSDLDADIYDEIASLPDSGTSDDIDSSSSSSGGGDREESDAEREWKESLQQLELLLTMVVVPYVGKYFGRRCAYWSWAKFMEWKYPSVEVKITSQKAFRTAGAIEVAASL